MVIATFGFGSSSSLGALSDACFTALRMVPGRLGWLTAPRLSGQLRPEAVLSCRQAASVVSLLVIAHPGGIEPPAPQGGWRRPHQQRVSPDGRVVESSPSGISRGARSNRRGCRICGRLVALCERCSVQSVRPHSTSRSDRWISSGLRDSTGSPADSAQSGDNDGAGSWRSRATIRGQRYRSRCGVLRRLLRPSPGTVACEQSIPRRLFVTRGTPVAGPIQICEQRAQVRYTPEPIANPAGRVYTSTPTPVE